MHFGVMIVGALCSCGLVSTHSRHGEQQKVTPRNFCTKLNSLQVVPSCDGGLVGQGVVIGTGACLLGQTEDGYTWLYVPLGGQAPFSDVQRAVEEDRVCLAPDAKDFGIPDDKYPGIMYMELALFVRCDSSYCADPEGLPDWHYEPSLMEEYKNSD